jgi:hypothetical protein
MLLDRHRVAKLVELSALERTLQGPERLLREEDVALLVKAAYDDATEAARAEFMARIKTYPETAWPWSTMQSMAPRGVEGLEVGWWCRSWREGRPLGQARALRPRGADPDPRSSRVGRRRSGEPPP